MAIGYFGQTRVPAVDDGANNGPTATVTPPASMVSGQFVFVWVFGRGQDTITNTVDGGQSWTASANTQQGTVNTGRLFWCVFDGTWDADPVFDAGAIAAGVSAWMVVLDGADTTSPWDVTPALTGQAAAATFTEATWSTNTANAWAFVAGASSDNNTWTVDNSMVAPSGSGNVYWRNSSGGDSSVLITRKAMGAAGAVGATVLTQATAGNDAGITWRGAVKEAVADTRVPRRTPYPQLLAH
jgi:hypothetical protein